MSRTRRGRWPSRGRLFAAAAKYGCRGGKGMSDRESLVRFGGCCWALTPAGVWVAAFRHDARRDQRGIFVPTRGRLGLFGTSAPGRAARRRTRRRERAGRGWRSRSERAGVDHEVTNCSRRGQSRGSSATPWTLQLRSGPPTTTCVAGRAQFDAAKGHHAHQHMMKQSRCSDWHGHLVRKVIEELMQKAHPRCARLFRGRGTAGSGTQMRVERNFDARHNVRRNLATSPTRGGGVHPHDVLLLRIRAQRPLGGDRVVESSGAWR